MASYIINDPFRLIGHLNSHRPGHLLMILHIISLCLSIRPFLDCGHLVRVPACLDRYLSRFCNCSVPSQLHAKIHSISATPMGFLPSGLCFLTVSAASAQTYCTVTRFFRIGISRFASTAARTHKIKSSLTVRRKQLINTSFHPTLTPRTKLLHT